MGAKVFMSYSHKDEALRDELEVQLAMLKRQGLIEVWHDRRLLAGDHLDWSISKEMDEADIVLLLVSPDFIASDYCYKIEKARALDRHRAGTARLISVILRPCDWTHTDLREFLVTPTDAKPVTLWPNKDEAFLDVARSIRRAIEALGAASRPRQVHDFIELQRQPPQQEVLPRSSNLRLRKTFTEADHDRFLEEGFEFIDRFFQGSSQELQARNPGIEARYRRVDGNAFVVSIYRTGARVAACGIRLGGMHGRSINYSQGDTAPKNSCNESLSVEADDQKMYLRALMSGHHRGGTMSAGMSHEGAAEYLWSLLIEPLQGR
jgi:hypothetical protein